MENLKQALNHGLVLKEVHSAISFNQDEWLKPYIEMNNKLRTEAKNEFDKDFFKMMNNPVFGRTLENVEEITWFQNQFNIQQSFLSNICFQ